MSIPNGASSKIRAPI
jgi:predicted enzyme related to lactoylglutathione lyase